MIATDSVNVLECSNVQRTVKQEINVTVVELIL